MSNRSEHENDDDRQSIVDELIKLTEPMTELLRRNSWMNKNRSGTGSEELEELKQKLAERTLKSSTTMLSESMIQLDEEDV